MLERLPWSDLIPLALQLTRPRMLLYLSRYTPQPAAEDNQLIASRSLRTLIVENTGR
jgi:hypothetical protein